MNTKRKIGLVQYLSYGSGDFLGAGTTALEETAVRT
jgi:oligogalacturonide transporter